MLRPNSFTELQTRETKRKEMFYDSIKSAFDHMGRYRQLLGTDIATRNKVSTNKISTCSALVASLDTRLSIHYVAFGKNFLNESMQISASDDI